MSGFIKSFIVFSYLWVYVLFPTLHAQDIHCIEVIADEGVDYLGCLTPSQTYYIKAIQQTDNEPLKILQQDIFLQKRNLSQVISISAEEETSESKDHSPFTETSFLQSKLACQIDSEGFLIVNVPENFTNQLEIIGSKRFKLQMGQDRLEVVSGSQSVSTPFIFKKEAAQWTIRSMPAYVEMFKLFSKKNWINKASFSVEKPIHIKAHSFQNAGLLNWIKGGDLQVEDIFQNNKEAKITTSSHLKIEAHVGNNEGFLDIGGALALRGNTFHNRGRTEISDSLDAELVTLFNYSFIESLNSSSLIASTVFLEAGSTFSTLGSGYFETKGLGFFQRGKLIGENLSINVGINGIAQGTFDNTGTIDSEKLLSLTVFGKFLNREKSSILSRSSALRLKGNKQIENRGFLGAYSDIEADTPAFLSTSNAQIMSPQLTLQNTQVIDIQHNLKLDSVNFKARQISLKSVEALNDIAIESAVSLALNGHYKSHQGKAYFKAYDFTGGSGTFEALKGTKWVHGSFVGKLYPNQKLKMTPSYKYFTKNGVLDEGNLLIKMLGIGSSLNPSRLPLEIILKQGLTVSGVGFHSPNEITLTVPQTSPRGLDISNVELKSVKGLNFVSPYHEMKLGKILDDENHQPARLESAGHLYIEALRLNAPCIQLFGNKSFTIKTHDTMDFGYFFEGAKKISVISPRIDLTNMIDYGCFFRGPPRFCGPDSFWELGAKYYFSNSSFLASNGNIQLLSGHSIKNQFITVYTAQGDLHVETPGLFESVSTSYKIGKNAHIKANEFNFTNLFGNCTGSIVAYVSPKNPNSYLTLHYNTPYASSPLSEIQADGDLTFQVNKGHALLGSIHAAGVIRGSESIIFEDKTLQPELKFTQSGTCSYRFDDIKPIELAQKLSSSISAATGISFENCKQLCTNSSVIQTDIFVAQSEKTHIGFQQSFALSSKKTFTSWNDLITHFIPGQRLFDERQDPEFVLSPVVPLAFPALSRPSFVLTPQGELKPTGSYRFLSHPLLETQLIARAMSHSLKRNYLELPDGTRLKGTQDIRAAALQETQSLAETLRLIESAPASAGPLVPINPQQHALVHFKKTTTPMLLYDLLDYVGSNGVKEKVWAPHFYLPPHYDSNPSLSSGEGGVFANSFYLDTKALNFTGVITAKDHLKIVYEQARLTKHHYSWSQRSGNYYSYKEGYYEEGGRLEGGYVELLGKENNSLLYQEAADIISDSDLLNYSQGNIVIKGSKNRAKKDHLIKAKGLTLTTTTAASGNHSHDGCDIKRDYVTHTPSEASAGGKMLVLTGEDGTLIQGSIVEGDEAVGLASAGKTAIEDRANTSRYEYYSKSSRKGWFSRGYNTTHEVSSSSSLAPSQVRSAKGPAGILSSQDIDFKASLLHSDVEKRLQSEEGRVNFLTATTTSSYQKQESSGNVLWQKQSAEGHTHQTVHMPQLTGKGPLLIEATQGVTAEIKSSGSLAASIQALGSQPGLEWIKELAERQDVKWSQVAEIHDSWHYEHESLNPQAAALIGLAVAVALSWTGAGSAFATSVLQLEAGGIAAGAAAASFNALASQASVSLLNNKGDIGKTLEDLASSASMRSLAVTILTTGADKGASAALGSQTASAIKDSVLSYAVKFADHLKNQLISNVIHASLSSALEGGEWDRKLLEGVQGAVIGAAAATGANFLGNAYKDPKGALHENFLGHKAAHAALGALTAELSGKDAASGAIGAVVGEVVGEIQREKLQDQFFDGEIDFEELQAETQKAIELSRFLGGATAFAMGGDVLAAAQTARNAAEENALHKILDAAILIYDLGELGYAYCRGDDEATKEALVNVGVDLVGMVSPTGNLVGYGRLAGKGIKALKDMKKAKHVLKSKEGVKLLTDASKTGKKPSQLTQKLSRVKSDGQKPDQNINIIGKRRKNRILETGEPESIVTNPPGTTVRKYGPDGYPQKEFNKGHIGGVKVPSQERVDHIHDYKPNPYHPDKKPDRQPGRPVRNKDKVDLGLIKRNENGNN